MHVIHTNATEATITVTELHNGKWRLDHPLDPPVKRILTYSTTTTGRFAQESTEIHALAAQIETWGVFSLHGIMEDGYGARGDSESLEKFFALVGAVHTCGGIDCDCLCPNPVTL